MEQQTIDQHGNAAIRYQQAIERIKGVMRSTVVLDGQGNIEEVHIIASPARRPKGVVRDIESLLLARFGVRIDYRKVSLVQLDPEDAVDSPMRLRFVSAVQASEDANSVRIVLQDSRGSYTGTAQLAADPSDEAALGAAVSATLSAVQQAIGKRIPLTVMETRVISLNEERVCLAVVSASTGLGQERLSGTCFVVHDVSEAASKATLDAINRRIPVWVSDMVDSKQPEGLPVSRTP